VKHAALAAVAALLVAAPLAAQRPAPRDTTHRMMGHAMPAQAATQGASPMMGHMRGAPQGMAGCAGMMGGMMHDSAMGGMMGMEGMMALMAGSAEHVLARKAPLGLTGVQERRITAIRDDARAAHDAAMRDAAGHERELMEVMRAAAPDTGAVEAHFDGAFAAMGRAHLAMLRSAALTRAVLTDAQRSQVDSVQAATGCGMMTGAPAATGSAARRP
jgi:hypothetical protein